MALFALLLTQSNVYAEESQQKPTEEVQSSIRYYNSKVSGSFNVKTWLGSNSVDQFIQLGPGIQNASFVNSKQSVTMLELESQYWFGFITQNQLFNLGPLFGIGFDFAYGKNSFSNVSLGSDQPLTADIITYLMDISFIKLALIHDEKMDKYLSLTGHYMSYSNSLSGSSPLNGLGIGIDSQYNFDDNMDLYFKLNYIPSASSTRLNTAWGSEGELGMKWFISPKAAINVSYKALYYNGIYNGVANVPTGTGNATTPTAFSINVHDILHGLSIGANYHF